MFTEELVYEMYRRIVSGHSQRNISKSLQLSRNTIREYQSYFTSSGISLKILQSKNEFSTKYKEFHVTRKKRSSNPTDELNLHKDEIEKLLNTLDAKSAHEVLVSQDKTSASYSTFKRFVNKNIIATQTKNYIRIELPPGKEIQMDYAKMGMLFNSKTGKKESVHAFLGILSHSRLPFIEFVRSQDQQSFASSFVSMFEFYGGVPEFITIDNLKTGVIRPSLYDPEINQSFLELAQYYQTFISPARVRTPTDKGKVERFVQTARSLYNKLIIQYPNSSLKDLNQYANDWILKTYGTRKHGTTGIEPLVAFNEEKKYLKKLPQLRFEIPIWKEVKVHPDQFIQFDKCRYSIPVQYRGDTLFARKNGNIIRLFKNSTLIKEHIITGEKVVYDKNDFPEVVREMMNGSFGSYLLKDSKKYGELSYELIQTILETDSYLHTRQAQGILRIIEEFAHNSSFDSVMRQAIHKKIKIPTHLKKMFEEHKLQSVFDFEVQRSSLGDEMVRPSNYYFEN